MFDLILSHGEPLIKNNKLINFDNTKIKKINRTSHAITGSFLNSMDFNDLTTVTKN